MCSLIAGASAGLSILGNYMGQQAAADAAQSQMDAQRQAAIKEMNYKFQNYEQERVNAFDAASDELDKVTHQNMELNSKVAAAVNENMSGRTAELINRQAQGDTDRTTYSIKENYGAKSNEIDLNKEAVALSTKDYVKNLNDSAPKMPSAFSNFLDTAGIALGWYTKGQDERQNRINAGNVGYKTSNKSVYTGANSTTGSYGINNLNRVAGIDTNFGYTGKKYNWNGGLTIAK